VVIPTKLSWLHATCFKIVTENSFNYLNCFYVLAGRTLLECCFENR
jgi:hypothetical protein